MARSALARPMLALEPEPVRPIEGVGRIRSIDILRGIVIVLMALDHVRDYFHVAAFTMNPLDVEQTSVWLYATRWITHFCAPVFVFLAGVSAFLYGARADSRGQLSRFLLTRGLWLILLEFTLINWAWNFAIPGLALIVIWAIGASMVVLAALVWLPRVAVLAVGLLILVGHNLLDPLTPQDFGQFDWLWMVLHDPGPIISDSGQFLAFVAYPLLPWIGVMAVGYGLGAVFLAPEEERARFLTWLGLGMIAAFLIIRATNLYGDANLWTGQSNALRTVGDYLDTTKYPPSLLYVLMTLGPALAIMPWLEKLKGPVAGLFTTYGRVPFFVYVGHILLAHLLMVAVGMAMGHPFGLFQNVMADPSRLIAAGWGFNLFWVYAVWILVLAILYPACRWFGDLKSRRKDWWLSYL